MYRNITVLSYQGNGIGLSHNPATGAAKVKTFNTEKYERDSNAATAIATYYMNAIANASLEEKATFNFVTLDNVAIKAFTIRKLMKDNPEVTADEVLDYLIQDFYEEETIAELKNFIDAYIAVNEAGHTIGFRKMSEVQEAEAYKGTLTATQQELLRLSWNRIAPQKPIELIEEESGLL